MMGGRWKRLGASQRVLFEERAKVEKQHYYAKTEAQNKAILLQKAEDDLSGGSSANTSSSVLIIEHDHIISDNFPIIPPLSLNNNNDAELLLTSKEDLDFLMSTVSRCSWRILKRSIMPSVS
jgi:hypothetical protein